MESRFRCAPAYLSFALYADLFDLSALEDLHVCQLCVIYSISDSSLQIYSSSDCANKILLKSISERQ